MARNIRTLPHPQALVEITQRTTQGRFLLRPSERLNALFVGCLSRAMANTGVSLHAVVVLSDHFHLLGTYSTVQQMSSFMGQAKTSLSKEIGRLHDWPGAMFDGRYHAIALSQEPEIQLERLRYLLSQGVKEGLVLSPREWPGIHSAGALSEGEPLRGVWVDRTGLYRARQRDPKVREAEFTTEEELPLTPLPIFSEMSAERQRETIDGLVREIEEEAAAKHNRERSEPAGVSRVLRYHPHHRPERVAQSPQPYFHAVTRAARQTLMEGLREFLRAYRAAAERLAAGEVHVMFPENCFPPRQPFVEPMLI